MDSTARATQVVDDPARVASVRQTRRRRRPSGVPPPLPRHLEKTGVGWLLAAAGLVVVFTVTFAANRHGAVTVTAAEERVAWWLAELRDGWLAAGVAVAAFPAGWLASKILAWCIVVPLLVFRRIRHLVVYVVALAVTLQLTLVLSAVLKRPRPFGVVIDGSWNGYALPSVAVAMLAASLGPV